MVYTHLCYMARCTGCVRGITRPTIQRTPSERLYPTNQQACFYSLLPILRSSTRWPMFHPPLKLKRLAVALRRRRDRALARRSAHASSAARSPQDRNAALSGARARQDGVWLELLNRAYLPSSVLSVVLVLVFLPCVEGGQDMSSHLPTSPSHPVPSHRGGIW